METAETLADAPLQPPDTLLARPVEASVHQNIRHVYTYRPRTVATVVFVVYGINLAVFAANGHDPRNLEFQGRRFVAQGNNASSVIRLDTDYTYPGGDIGYDGQFYTYIALDPVRAAAYIDNPAGRMGRIVYPLVARLLALGQPALIPWTLILVNWLTIVGGTWLAARWLARRNVSPWWALIYGLSGGLCLGLTHDLTEPLAYALAMAALLVLDDDGNVGKSQSGWPRLLASGALFALAGLTRETALAFPVAVALAWCLQRRVGIQDGVSRSGWRRWLQWSQWQEAATLIALAALPYLAWKLVLRVWLGANGLPDNWLPAPYPFAGLIALWPWNLEQQVALLLVALPALLIAPLALSALRETRGHSSVAWALALNLLWLVVFLPRDTWVDITAAARLSDGVVAAVLCIPLWTRQRRTWLLVLGMIWCLLTPLLLFSLAYLGHV